MLMALFSGMIHRDGSPDFLQDFHKWAVKNVLGVHF